MKKTTRRSRRGKKKASIATPSIEAKAINEEE